MRKGDIVVYVSCTCIAALMFYLGADRILDQDCQHKLSVKDSRSIIEQIGVDSFERLKSYHCEEPLAFYIKTGKWRDSWCADKYQHLDFDLITKGEHG